MRVKKKKWAPVRVPKKKKKKKKIHPCLWIKIFLKFSEKQKKKENPPPMKVTPQKDSTLTPTSYPHHGNPMVRP